MTPSLYLGLRRARVVSSGPASPQGGPVKPRRPQGTPGKTRRRAKDRIASIRSGGAPPASPEDTLFEVVCEEVFRNWKPRTRRVRFDLYPSTVA